MGVRSNNMKDEEKRPSRKQITQLKTGWGSKQSSEKPKHGCLRNTECTASWVTGETQIRTTLRFHLSPVTMAKANKTNGISCRQRWQVRVDMEVRTVTMGVCVQFLGKTGRDLPQDPTPPLWANTHNTRPQRHWLSHVHCCSIITVGHWKQPRCLSVGYGN